MKYHHMYTYERNTGYMVVVQCRFSLTLKLHLETLQVGFVKY